MSLSAGALQRRSETRTVHCNPDARVRVENDAGLIEVVGWEHDRVELVAERHAARAGDLDKMVVQCGGGPGEVLVTYTASAPLLDAWVDFRLHAPRMAALDIRNASGDVQVSGFHGPSRASTASGSIRAARMSGTSTLTSASGEIQGAALEGTVFARSASGRVGLHGNLAGDHRVETASGEIMVDGVEGSIDARSASGAIDVRGRLRGRNSLHTVSGDIDVQLLAGSEVEVRSKSVRQNYDHRRGPGILLIETTSGEIRLTQEG